MSIQVHTNGTDGQTHTVSPLV